MIAQRGLLLALCVSLAACGTVYRDTDTPMTAQAIDPTRYAGLWYEIARFPVSFQRGCTATTAEYGVTGPDTISVVNTCRDETPNGPAKQVVGSADIEAPGKLRVRFDSVPFVRAPYWVLWVDEAYDTAVVGVPSGKAGWVLARTPEIPDDQWQAALSVLRTNGYDTTQLLRTEQPIP
ncbi:lipocalin family protein [Rhodobacteraceae bacterium SC52]|nr:lipocalin family protein [Rhodobacteraceae bacterium SC52]